MPPCICSLPPSLPPSLPHSSFPSSISTPVRPCHQVTTKKGYDGCRKAEYLYAREVREEGRAGPGGMRQAPPLQHSHPCSGPSPHVIPLTPLIPLDPPTPESRTPGHHGQDLPQPRRDDDQQPQGHVCGRQHGCGVTQRLTWPGEPLGIEASSVSQTCPIRWFVHANPAAHTWFASACPRLMSLSHALRVT